MAAADNIQVLAIKKLMKAAFGRWEDQATFKLDVAPSNLNSCIAVYIIVTKLQPPDKEHIPKWMFWKEKKNKPTKSRTVCIGHISEKETIIDCLKRELKRYINEDYSAMSNTSDGKAIMEFLNAGSPKLDHYKELISKL